MLTFHNDVHTFNKQNGEVLLNAIFKKGRKPKVFNNKKAVSDRWQCSPIVTFEYNPAMKNGEVDLMQFPGI